MAKKDQLAPLILSLTPSEKKYFVQFSSLRSDDKAYMKLYQCVLRDKEFNVKKLGRELGKTPANLAHEKEYLFQNILKALRNFHDKMPEVELNNMSSDVAILKERQLYQAAEIKTKKALKAANSQSRFEVAWKLLDDEKFMVLKLQPVHDYMVQHEKLNNEMAQMTEYMQWVNGFNLLGAEIEKIYLKMLRATTPAEMEMVKEQTRHSLFKKKFVHPWFRFQQHYLLNHLYQLLSDKKQQLTHIRKALQLIERHPYALQANVLLYTGCINGYMVSLSANRQFKEYLAFLEKLKNRYYRNLPFNQAYLDQRFNAYYFYYWFDYYMNHRYQATQYRVAIKQLLREFEQKADSIKETFNDAQWLQMQRNAVNLYFFYLHDDHAALHWANRMINEPGPSPVKQMIAVTKATILLIHFQLKNYAILPDQIESAKRYIKKYGFYTPVEEETFSFILNFKKGSSEQQRKEAFKVLQDKYANLKATFPEPKLTFSRIFYELWLDRNLS